MAELESDFGFEPDRIGPWSEIKLDIIRKYAEAFSKIVNRQPFHASYIDGFAGAGLHVRRASGELVEGSTVNVANISPPFNEYHLVEINPAKAMYLTERFGEMYTVQVHNADCNDLLVSEILPSIRYKEYKRALCLLDPYGLHLDWEVVRTAGRQRTVDVLINFPTLDMNRDVLWNNPGKVSDDQAARMTRFWGDESWREASYTQEETLFGPEQMRLSNPVVVAAYCQRLKEAAGFEHVAEPLPMKNTKGGTVYYLVLASQKDTGRKIMNDIFKKHR